MPTSSKRRIGPKKVNRTTTQQRRIHTTRNSIRELFKLQQQLRNIEMSALDQIKNQADLCRKYAGKIDGRYTTPLLEGAVDAVRSLGVRLESYAQRINALEVKNLQHTDITLDAMGVIADISDEQIIIDTNIYHPLFDIRVELNRVASPEDQLDVNELAEFIDTLNNTLSTGEGA